MTRTYPTAEQRSEYWLGRWARNMGVQVFDNPWQFTGASRHGLWAAWREGWEDQSALVRRAP